MINRNESRLIAIERRNQFKRNGAAQDLLNKKRDGLSRARKVKAAKGSHDKS